MTMGKKKALALKITAVVLLSVLAFVELAALVTVIRYRRIASLCEEERAISRLDVDTDGIKVVSKENYVDCKVSISGTEINEFTARIRGRGNTTWDDFLKKPYRIKFDDRVSVFGGEANKNWVLLAMANDISSVKDRLAFTMARAIGTDVFVPSYNYVELYLNGLYKGLYLMTEQVDENVGRTGIEAPISPEDTEVPFLVELDDYASDEGIEGVDWFAILSKKYAVKYPDSKERYTQEQFDYIKSYISAVDAACEAGDFERLGELVDVETFIDYYLIQEIMGQQDINWKSVYMYKSKDGLMKMGPVWDFDWGAIGPSYTRSRNNKRGDVTAFRSSGNWFEIMFSRSASFRAALSERFDEIKPVVLGVIEEVRQDRARIEIYAKRNHLRWHWFFIGESWEGYYNEVLDWCRDRTYWMDEVI